MPESAKHMFGTFQKDFIGLREEAACGLRTEVKVWMYEG
jgi:hypothetical protein